VAGKVGVTRGEGRQQEVDGGDGGRAVARGKLCAGGRRGSRGAEGVQRKKKRGRRSGGPVCENQKLQGPHRKERFPADLEVF
jgi:hypothetical protein